jgi:hypothetical protein
MSIIFVWIRLKGASLLLNVVNEENNESILILLALFIFMSLNKSKPPRKLNHATVSP